MEIRKQLFMGNGEQSLAQVGHLYLRLGQALTTLGGIQQPPRPCDPKEACEEWEQEVEDGEHEIKQIAKEIHVALTGEKPSRGENLWKEFLQSTPPDYEHPHICGLCGNHGVVRLEGVRTPAGVELPSLERPCICPNGRAQKSRQKGS